MNDLFNEEATLGSPVECLGLTFNNGKARREHFLKLLADKLKDPEFRKLDGFPSGSDEDILALSDPPYYTACPNPFFQSFIDHFGRPYSTDEKYYRAPFVADVSVAKTDHLYKSHRYHTKVPYKAIAQYLLHYTRPGDVIVDGFCGTGMMGVAAGYISNPEREILNATANHQKPDGEKSNLEAGPRHALLVDLSPAATSLAASFNSPVDAHRFSVWARKALATLEKEVGWLYQCDHGDQSDVGLVTEYVWSEIFSCPECTGKIDFLSDACDPEAIPLEKITCPHCKAELTKAKLEKRFESYIDTMTGKTETRPVRALGRIHYKVGKNRFTKTPTQKDLDRIALTEKAEPTNSLPIVEIPYMHMTHERARMDRQGVTHYHHLFTSRMRVVLSKLWSMANVAPTEEIKRLGRFWIDSHFLNLSIQNCYRPGVSFPYNPISGIYYVSSLISEPNPFIAYENKLKQILRGFGDRGSRDGEYAVMTGSCTAIPINDSSIDYIFTDPPFGENIYYSDLNFLVEAWSRVSTNANNEVIVDKAKKKGLPEYQHLMQRCFSEYYRILKPGRWMTVVFSNSKAAVWNAIQVGLQQAGFVVAEVTALDKVQGSFRQVTSTTAVKQDLVISAYKPDGGLEDRLNQHGPTIDSAWEFVQTHLKQLPTVKVTSGYPQELLTIVERDPRRIYDRMASWFIRHGTMVPISTPEFLAELPVRFREADGMLFLPDQLMEYEKARARIPQVAQAELFVSDERSAIDWLANFLLKRPSTRSDIHPEYFPQIGSAKRKGEIIPELDRLLEDNFIQYDGTGDVPSQIHSYLSTNHKDLRSLDKSNPALTAKAKDRWYVPDPNKAQDLEKKRERTMLKEFETYKTFTGRKIKESRLEVLRAGFRAAWANKDYKTIMIVANMLPEATLQEDEKLLLWYDQALTRMEAGV